MKITVKYHAGNPNMCRIPELEIKQMPECEGGGWWIKKEQAEFLAWAAEGVIDTTIDQRSPMPTWVELVKYWRDRSYAAEQNLSKAMCDKPSALISNSQGNVSPAKAGV